MTDLKMETEQYFRIASGVRAGRRTGGEDEVDACDDLEVIALYTESKRLRSACDSVVHESRMRTDKTATAG